MDVKRAAAFLLLSDVPIDGLVADRENLETREPADDRSGLKSSRSTDSTSVHSSAANYMPS